MVAFLTDSEHCSVSETEREKAWHLLAVLLSLGRPARPAELAARCRLFHASPDSVEFLCSIPDSPLFLKDDLFITISLAAFSALGEFVSNAIINFVPRMTLRVSGPKRLGDDVVRTYFRKRKGHRSDPILLPTSKRRLLSSYESDEDNEILQIQSASTKAHVDIADNMIRNMSLLTSDKPVMEYDLGILNQERAISPFLLDSNVGLSSYGLEKIEHIKDENEVEMKIIVHREFPVSVHVQEYRHSFLDIVIDSNIPKEITEERVLECHQEPALLISTLENPVLCKETQMDEMEFKNKTGLTAKTCLQEDTRCNASPEEADGHVSHACKAARSRIVEEKEEVNCKEGRNVIDFGTPKSGPEKAVQTDKTAQMHMVLKNGLGSTSLMNYNDMMTSLDRKKTTSKVESQAVFTSAEPSTAKKQPTKSSVKLQSLHKDSSTLGLRVLSESLDYNKAVNFPKQQDQCKRDQKCMSTKLKLKQSRNHNMLTKENRADSSLIAPKNQSEPKALPNFESFVVKEEEGSGGYGTVYRAQRKDDGKTFAIKCPHANAHIHHVNNEMKMLERFGGRNFVIKYEGSFECGNSECFVLEHVEHDRPEVLKKEIDIFELQWYGYCMFRALASLHKQGVVHRDVKPGNFLFSRNLNKGYLIDFNLAMDLHQKYGTNSKSKTSCSMSFDHVPLPSTKSAPPSKGRRVVTSRFLEAVSWEKAKDSKPSLEPKNMKKRADLKAYTDLGSRHVFKSQGADCSGITSTKDATSTRTPSAERLREPLPCQGRKELISLVQEAMQSPNHEAVSVPASQRKRIAAPPGKIDRKLVYLTPMPLHSIGIAVAGAGLLKHKGDGKQRREGPCVGTKGFRAPEVLFKSPHQGSKVDIWSAGVTLLYLMVGRTPFVGDPEQNIKDIAKLRGSEDLWEVAKLHNRESSFPVELFDIQSLPSIELQEWCKMNTKRPDFLDLIPRSLFDLVDKCLTVNPRLRISAEEALRHKFFATCHEGLRKQRLLRQGLSVDSGSAHVSHGQV